MTVAQPADPSAARAAALERVRELAVRLSGDAVALPVTDAASLDMVALARDPIHYISDPEAPRDPARYGVLVDGFRRFIQDAPEGVSVVVLDRSGTPEVRQRAGEPFPPAVDLIERTIMEGAELKDIRPRSALDLWRGFGMPSPPRLPAPANDNQPRGRGLPPAKPELVASGDFVRGFVPPDYLVDGIMQSGFLYSLTGQTGSGKTAVALLLAACTALGVDFAGREVKRGRVFYFAGENPDDVAMRWIGLCHSLDLDANDLDVHFVRGVFSVPDFLSHIESEAERLGGVGLIIVDTTAAFFTGTDENSNTEMGRYARQLRELAQLRWRPAVLAASHPIKNAAADSLLPRGGGAFLNEVDGNLSLAKRGDTSVLHWQGKHRGPDFAALTFDMQQVQAPALVDSRGRAIPTVMAAVVEDGEVAERAAGAGRDDELMLLAIRQDGNRSLRDLAEALSWHDADGEPSKKRAQNSTDRLKRAQLVAYELATWKLTRKGESAATEAAGRLHKQEMTTEGLRRMASASRRRRQRTTGTTQNGTAGTESDNDY